MKNYYEAFKTEDDLELDGVWKEYKSLVKVKIARAGNKHTAYDKALSKAAKKYKDAGTDKKIDRERPWAEVYSKSIIKGWMVKDDKDKWVEGICIPKGDKYVIEPVTPENIKKTLLDLPDLFDLIKEDANQMSTFQKEEEEETAKN